MLVQIYKTQALRCHNLGTILGQQLAYVVTIVSLVILLIDSNFSNVKFNSKMQILYWYLVSSEGMVVQTLSIYWGDKVWGTFLKNEQKGGIYS